MLESSEPKPSTSCTTPASNILITPPRSNHQSEKQQGQEMTLSPKMKRKRKETPPGTEEQQEISNKTLALWIGGSNLSISAVEDPNMEKYVKTLNSQVQVF